MELGISTASFFTKLATEDTFQKLKEFNVPTCEVFLSSFSEYEGVVSDLIVANKLVKVNSIHTLTNQFEPELFSHNDRAKMDAEQILRKVLSTGKRLGASYYTFHGATRLKKIEYNFDYERLSKIINQLCSYCNEYGIKLSYETVHWAYFNDPKYFLELKDRCPDLYATLDIKQIMQADADYRDFLKVIGDRLSTVHLCDYDDTKHLCLPGQGKFDFIELFKRLQDNGFEGSCLVEVYPQSYQTYDELKNSYEYLLNCLAKANH